MTNSFLRETFRIIRLFSGLFAYSFGIVLTLRANVGYAPWEVFQKGLTLHLGLTMGQAHILVAVILVLIVVFMKENVGFGTICNMIFIGVFMDIILSWNRIPLMYAFFPGAAMMIGGLFVLGIASVLYIGAGYGAGPRDSLMVVLTKRTGKPVGLCRGYIEGTVLAVGWLLGGYAGIGTVISALGIGVAIQIVFSILRFDVKKIHQESFYETYLRFRNMLK